MFPKGHRNFSFQKLKIKIKIQIVIMVVEKNGNCLLSQLFIIIVRAQIISTQKVENTRNMKNKLKTVIAYIACF